ncbi:MAG: hypothetical protein ACKO3N_06065, partial [Verrucomicrobiota bacterium]
LAFLAAGLGLLVGMRLWLRGQQASPRVQVAFSLAVLAGALLGVGASTRLGLQVNPVTRMVGAPLPVSLQRRESGQWVHQPAPRVQTLVVTAANGALLAAALGAPACLLLAALRTREDRSPPPA